MYVNKAILLLLLGHVDRRCMPTAAASPPTRLHTKSQHAEISTHQHVTCRFPVCLQGR